MLAFIIGLAKLVLGIIACIAIVATPCVALAWLIDRVMW